MEVTRRDALRALGLFGLGVAAVACGASLGTDPVIIMVPDWFDEGGDQHNLFLRTQGGYPAVDTEFFIQTASGEWERPPQERFQTQDGGVWRQARDGDEGDNAWIYYPQPGEVYLYTPLDASVA